MSHPKPTVTAALIFQDTSTTTTTSERDFIVVSAQHSPLAGLHYEFHTSPILAGNGSQLQTVVTGRTASQAPLVVLAQMEWTSRHLGNTKILVTRPPVETSSTSLCLPASKPGCRYFLMDISGSGMKSQYVWTRDKSSYTLTGPGNTLLARYDRNQTSSQPPHASMDIFFSDKTLLLMALIALTLNRWLDGPNSPHLNA